MIDFSKINQARKSMPIDPRDIFMALPNRKSPFEYPRDVQSEVWKKWYECRENKNNIIKMNTGSGKTVVGLIILQSCLHENCGPAVYVAPSYLISQIEAEAHALGIKTTQNEASLEYLDKKSILVINIQKLFNGKSVFGLREYNNIQIGSVIIDDVHACISDIEEQFSIRISRDCSAYNDLLALFSQSLKDQFFERYTDIFESGTSSMSCLVPFWIWQAKIDEVRKIINDELSDDSKTFRFPLISDVLNLCSCFCSFQAIEIIPPCIPVEKIKSFAHAKRRIFMTATLPDDSAFVSVMGLNDDNFTIISPEKANDIGDRLILFPQFTSPKIQDIDIRNMVYQMSRKHNIVIIVPSRRRASFWEDYSDIIVDSENLDSAVSQLKQAHVGLVVFINKYEGIDLPNDACRILVIDGAPLLKNSRDLYEDYLDSENPYIWRKLIQKIEQGMGRGVRSNNDYSAIILMQKTLANVLFCNDAYKFFSKATQSQFELSKTIWTSLQNKPMSDYVEAIEQILSRDEGWTSISKESLANALYDTTPHVNPITMAIRKSFNLAVQHRYIEAAKVLRESEKVTTYPPNKGLLKQYIAQYSNFFNPQQAQEILLSALSDNSLLLKPINGVQFQPQHISRTQGEFLIEHCNKNNLDSNKYLIKISALLENLSFGVPYNLFETTIKELSFLLGIFSFRPESETGKGPDNFWCISPSVYLLIECKNESTTDKISKHDCAQLNTSIEWFKSLYHAKEKCLPMMIHQSNVFSFEATPCPDIRIMTPSKLDSFKLEIEHFCQEAVLPENFHNAVNLAHLLRSHQLFGEQIFYYFTEKYRKNY